MSQRSVDKTPTPLEETAAGGCVGCSRPDSFDDFVQCDECNSWWHMRCAGVTKSIAERPWSCASCLPLSVTSSSSSARITLRLKQLEEERAIQQREWEAEKRALEQERKAVQEKFRLLEEQLDECRGNRSRVSRRANVQRVTQWVDLQTPGVAEEEEGAVGGTPAVGAPGDAHTVGVTTVPPPAVSTLPIREQAAQTSMVERYAAQQ